MMNVMRSSQLQQKQPLIIIITTAGFNLNYPLYTIEYPFATKVLSGEIIADEYLALIWELDSVDEVNDESSWIKANPILEMEELQDTLMNFLRTEVANGKAKRDMAGVLVKNFNIWQSASTASFIHYPDWKEAAVDQKQDIKGRPIYIGVDLAYTGDLAAISWAVPIDEEETFFVDSHVFIVDPDERQRADRINYRGLIQEGGATACEGFIDTTQVAEFVLNLIEENSMECKGIYYDPAHGADFRNYLIRNGYDNYLTIVRQGPLTLSPASMSFKEDLLKGKIKHANNESLNLGVKNAIEKRNNDALMIDKAKNRNKIDSLAALINCWVEIPEYDFSPQQIDFANFSF